MTDWSKVILGATRNRAEPLLDGPKYFKSVVETIETAGTKGKGTDYVYVLGWMLDIFLQLVEDNTNKTLFNLLSGAAQRDVEIRILIADNPRPKYAELGLKALLYLNNLPNTKVFLDPNTFFPQKFKAHLQRIADQASKLPRRKPPNDNDLTGLGRLGISRGNYPSIVTAFKAAMKGLANPGEHHEKVVIVKSPSGLIAYCGGIDFNENRVLSTIQGKPNPFPEMHDTACRLEGPAAYEVLERFKRRWQNLPAASKVDLRGSKEVMPKEAETKYHYAKIVGTYTSPDGSGKPDRSLRDAYLKIIENAKKFIYIEDPYLVNLDVAKALNKKLKETDFQKVFFATQDVSEATNDILIPKRKRSEFISEVISPGTPQLRKKVFFSMLDTRFSDTRRYHPGMHAKTLIVDDEIAIIGSANLTQRSFTIESETCVVVFDVGGEPKDPKDRKFAQAFRIETWKEFTESHFNDSQYEDPLIYPRAIEQGFFDAKVINGFPIPPTPFSMLTKYVENSLDVDKTVIAKLQNDLDRRLYVKMFLKMARHIIESDRIAPLVHEITNDFDSTLDDVSAIDELRDNPWWITKIFNIVWEEFIDPKAG